MRRSTTRRLRILALLAAVGAAVWYFWSGPESNPKDQSSQIEVIGEQTPAINIIAPVIQTNRPNSVTAPPVKAIESATPVSSTESSQLLRGGLELVETRPLEARQMISKAIASGQLDPQYAEIARGAAAQLANKTILSRQVVKGDRYCYYYSVKYGDMLSKIVDAQDLKVPYKLVMLINKISDARSLQAGHRLKLVRGPFHAEISKSRHTMDIYLQREGLEKVFVKRIKVGLGKNGATPIGSWRIAAGEKLHRPIWYPAPNSSHKGPVRPDEADYAFGDKALWIGLEGTDDNTRMLNDYGLHSTNDQTSIGKDESEGCIRLADEDIEFVNSLLAEVSSTVEIVP